MTGITFVNMWQADSREKQEALIEEMRAEVPALVGEDGFISLTAWKTDGTDYRVLVEGRWASQAHFDAAVEGNAQALAARARLEAFAKPAPGLFGGRHVHVDLPNADSFGFEPKPVPASGGILQKRFEMASPVLAGEAEAFHQQQPRSWAQGAYLRSRVLLPSRLFRGKRQTGRSSQLESQSK
jgi:heme-degrading monooxygenase HmoA